MGLGLLLFGLMAGSSAVKCGVENAKMMSKPYRYMDDGTPVYLDRLANEHINGEKVISKYNYQKGCMQDVGVRSGRVYYDEQEVQRKRFDDMNERSRQFAIKQGRKAYMKYIPEIKKEITCELSTGKLIAKLEREKVGDKKYVYRKYYTDLSIIRSKMWDGNYLPVDAYREPKDGDKGIEITKDEFIELNIWNGSHSGTIYTKYSRSEL